MFSPSLRGHDGEPYFRSYPVDGGRVWARRAPSKLPRSAPYYSPDGKLLPRQAGSCIDGLMDYPSPVRRWLAFGVDYVFLAAYVGLLLVVTFAVDPQVADRNWPPLQGQIVGVISLTLPVILYFTFCEASPWRATPGKLLLGLAVVHHTGRRLGIRRAFVRSLLKFLPWEMAHTALWRLPGWPRPAGSLPLWAWIVFGFVWLLLVAYVVSPFFNPQRRALYDQLAGAAVVMRSRAGR